MRQPEQAGRYWMLCALVCAVGVLAASFCEVHLLNAQQGTPASTSGVSAQVRAVATRIEAARSKIICGQAKVTFVQTTPKEYLIVNPLPPDVDSEPSPTGDDRMTATARWYLQAPRLSMFVTRQFNQSRSDTSRLVADETQAKLLSSHQGWVMPRKRAVSYGVWRREHELDPRSHIYFVETQALDQFLLVFNPPPTFQGEEIIEGSPCMKLEVQPHARARTTFWIDAEHGYVLRRREQYGKYEGKWLLEFQVRVPRLLESQGVWLPAVVEKRQFWDALAKTDSEDRKRPLHPLIQNAATPLPPIVQRITVSDFEAGCALPQEVFNLNWPSGIRVTNLLSDGTSRPKVEESRKELPKAPAKKRTTQTLGDIANPPLTAAEKAKAQGQLVWRPMFTKEQRAKMRGNDDSKDTLIGIDPRTGRIDAMRN
jgi:hypothetical protein